ncbi:MAG: TMEM143 family protein [Hyphomicrobiaceae bacterium]
MSTAQATQGLREAGLTNENPSASRPASKLDKSALADAIETAMFQAADPREKFIPVTPLALMDRLSAAAAWPADEGASVKRFFLYLANWRQQGYGARLLELARQYEPFSPDSDLLITRTYTKAEKKVLERQLVDGICRLMQQANYTRIDPAQIDIILTKDSHYGLDLHVDLKAFDELEIYYRGAVVTRSSRRSARKLYLRKEEFDLPVFQRLAIVFKLKSFDKRVVEVMDAERVDRPTAERRVRKRRGPIADKINSDFIYIKLFKNIPRSDLEMVFPNTRIQFRLFDKIKLGVTASGGLGMGVAGTISKIAVASNPIALAGALAGLGGIAVRQIFSFFNQRNKYMVTMAQNLYSHALADNRGVMTLLAERAAEEDTKEEMLLYSLLAKEHVHISELQDADQAIERYLASTFGLDTNFDVEDALGRLLKDGIVRQTPDGRLLALPPAAAAARIDELWDGYLDKLTVAETEVEEGIEYEGESPAALS